ncbi:unnamed protein product [Rangifer tarandus platyrhynchus]|uniref:Uncharacterized protein n=1 Tax=Rangifer tarandus platyrhynchus TaxID=3082113 RepID=A0AC59YE92_RANTA
MLLLLLSCLLPATNGKNCLQCWQELPALIDYDLQILWGTPGPPAELSQSLHSLFMNNHSSPENSYLGQDHLEEAAGTLFTHIDKAIKKLRDDKPSLLEEVRVLKQQFSKELEDISEGLKEKDIRSTLEIISCTTCQKHFLTCQDPALCPAWTGKNFRWAMGIGIALPLVTLAGGGCYIFWLEKKKKKKDKEAQKETLPGYPRPQRTLATHSLPRPLSAPAPVTTEKREMERMPQSSAIEATTNGEQVWFCWMSSVCQTDSVKLDLPACLPAISPAPSSTPDRCSINTF